ncbi:MULTISPECIES: hypothetical protein [Escherichia]|uniref:hypothetical protein n=1 Tax=Escherichia TaxID=561 RepID=UPI00103DF456|nr:MULTISPECIES: hypothetical protein [Escherichia]MQS69476.1 hypothetical protein [Escherichia coli]
MTAKEAQTLRERIAQIEREMMDFRLAMARVLSALYDSVHDLESWQQEHTMELTRLRDCLVLHFNLSEIQTACFDLGIEYDSIPGDSLDDKARELVRFMSRSGRLEGLIKYCHTMRPNAVW